MLRRTITARRQKDAKEDRGFWRGIWGIWKMRKRSENDLTWAGPVIRAWLGNLTNMDLGPQNRSAEIGTIGTGGEEGGVK
jgi:hypothetical protein